MRLSVVIVAAGAGRRMGFDKLAAPLAGKPVLRHSLDTILGLPAVADIVVVCPPERFALLDLPATAIPIHRVDGGTDRHHSVAAGLAAVAPGTTHVAIHDGARPLLHPEDFARCLECARSHGAAALGRRVTETLKCADSDDICSGSVSREGLWFMETPQIFTLPLLREAYDTILARGLTVTDEVSAVQETGHLVCFVESLHPNPKITRPADLILAAQLMPR